MMAETEYIDDYKIEVVNMNIKDVKSKYLVYVTYEDEEIKRFMTYTKPCTFKRNDEVWILYQEYEIVKIYNLRTSYESVINCNKTIDHVRFDDYNKILAIGHKISKFRMVNETYYYDFYDFNHIDNVFMINERLDSDNRPFDTYFYSNGSMYENTYTNKLKYMLGII